MNPAPRIRTIPGRNNATLTQYSSVKYSQPSQLFCCWKNLRMSPKTVKPCKKICKSCKFNTLDGHSYAMCDQDRDENIEVCHPSCKSEVCIFEEQALSHPTFTETNIMRTIKMISSRNRVQFRMKNWKHLAAMLPDLWLPRS